jgi:hypothetical protein
MAASKTLTVERKIAAARARLARLEERIGELMAQRADEEEALADLLKRREPSCANASESEVA